MVNYKERVTRGRQVYRCRSCGLCAIGVPATEVPPGRLDAYMRCRRCGSPTSSFKPIAMAQVPPLTTLGPCVVPAASAART